MLKPSRDTAGAKSGAIFEPLLDALDEASQATASREPSARTRNRARRIAYRQLLTASIEHPGGGVVNISVASRNLSPGGVGLLCNVFIHPGSACTLTLRTPDLEEVTVQGRVVHCHLVRGRVHEIGVKFNRAIGMGSFISPESMPQAEVTPAELQGHVLLLDDSPLEQMLFKHCINETRISLTAVRQAEAAIQALKADRYDIFVCDLNLDGKSQDGIVVVKQARTHGFIGPVILTATEIADDRHAVARAAGVNHFLSKPYKPHALLALLQRAHEDCGALVSAELLATIRSAQSVSEELFEAFRLEIGNHAQEILNALGAADIAGLRRALLAIKAASTGMGYNALAAVVDNGIGSLLSRPISAVRPGMLRIATACRALAQAAKPVGEAAPVA